jgi:murein DD-endopeptidase MepM/ murein hydrolase activator NlpD
LEGKTLFIPNLPGVFVPDHPRSELERLMASWRTERPGQTLFVGGERYTFFPGERFHPVERAFFLNVLFTFPVENGKISSRYGTRISPISGTIHFHNGLDIAAPAGNKVYAARDGQVKAVGFDGVLGNYLILQHPGGYMTVYGHLESRSVELNDFVNSGNIVGKVGSTGATTGPHLHFEVRKEGESRDPESLLPRRIGK